MNENKIQLREVKENGKREREKERELFASWTMYKGTKPW